MNAFRSHTNLRLLIAGFAAFLGFGTVSRVTAADAPPLATEILGTQQAVLNLLANRPRERARFVALWNQRLELHARPCLVDSSPASCLAQRDSELLRWLQLRRVGAILALPPIPLGPASQATYLHGSGTDGEFAFAAETPLMLFSSGTVMQVIDARTSAALLNIRRAVTQYAAYANERSSLSPNGRIIAETYPTQVLLRDASDGSTLIVLSNANNILWLDAKHFLLVHGTAGSPSEVLRLDGGSVESDEITLPRIDAALPIPGRAGQFLICFEQKVGRLTFSLDEGKQSSSLNFDRDSAIDIPSSASCNTAQFMADGTRVSIRDTFVPVDLGRAQISRYETAQVRDAVPTSDPNLRVISVYAEGLQLVRRTAILEAVDESTFKLLDAVLTRTGRLVYIPGIRRVGVKRRASIEVLALPAASDMVSAFDFFRNFRTEVARTSFEEPVYGNRNSEPLLFDPKLAAISQGAAVTGFGTYSSGKRLNAGSDWQYADVTVGKTQTPLVLVLASHDPMEWRIHANAGAQIALILIAGYEGSYATGVPGVRIVPVGSPSPYSRDSLDYDELDKVVTRLLGKGIGTFVGSYQRATFVLGQP